MGEVHETPNGDAVGHWGIMENGVAAPVVMYGGKVVDPHQNTKPKKHHSPLPPSKGERLLE